MNKSVLKIHHAVSGLCLFCVLGMFSAGVSAVEDACSKGFYAEVSAELSKAYAELGKPALSFAHLAVIKDLAVNRLEARSSSWPKGATFSISVLSDRISVATFCKDKSTKGEWTPKQK
jgi:hypothetical protein